MRQWFSRKSGIFKMASLILITSRQETLCLSLTFSYLAMFCKIYRYPKHRKTLSWGKLLLTSHYRTLTKQNCHVGQVLFMVNLFPTFGLVVCCFFLRTASLLILLKIGCPVNFLVVSEDRTTANFEHCLTIQIQFKETGFTHSYEVGCF